MLLCDQYIMPQSLKEALTVWSDAPDGSRLIAGGTDLLPWAREGRAGDVNIPMLVDLSRVEELCGYSSDDGRVRLGANVVFQRFLTDETLRRDAPCMPYCAIWFADDQIREQATLVGNLVNASPAADGTPAMLALNGEVEIASLEGDDIVRRNEALSDFVQGPGKILLKHNEIVTGVACDALPGYGGAFEKVGQRRSLVISTVCTACLIKPSDDRNTFEDARLAMGGIGPVPTRLEHIESFLAGKPISAEIIQSASQMVDGLVQSRTRQEYRKHVVEGFIERALRNALSDCGIELPADSIKEMAHA
ncbi:MAG: FAD binding domain-containing protein [Hyphomicrobiales bacterium]|nr:FAD binding domain-containing protein [Hyphomicrobiales bacterium]